MSVSGNPVAMYTPSNGQAHIFYRGDGDSRQGFVIEHVFWGEEYYNQPYVPKSEQWVGPNATYIQASRTPPPLAADDPATMFTDDTGQQHIFYVGIDNSLNHVFYDPKRNGLIYEQWESGAAGIPATMYTPGNDNQQHVFYRGTDNGFHQSFYIPGDGLSPETWVTPDQITYGNPATMYSYVGGLYLNAQQHLFYRTFGGGIGHTFWDPSRGRVTEPWWPGGTASNKVAALGDPATLFSPGADLQQHIFFLATDIANAAGGNFIYHIYYDPSNQGLTDEPWGPAVGNPATMYDPSFNQQHIFFRGDGDSSQGFIIEHVFWDPNRGRVTEQWVGPLSIVSGATQLPLAAGDPAALFTSSDNRQHMLYGAIDGNIYHVFFDPNGGPFPISGGQVNP